MQVTLRSHNRRVKRQLITELTWYDHDAKEMRSFQGSRLMFEYDPTSRKTVPKPVIEDTYCYCHSWDDIDEWVNNNKHKLEILETNPKYYITVELSDYDWHVFEPQLRSKSIAYEAIDET